MTHKQQIHALYQQIAQALGAEVTVLEALDRVLPTLDRELSQSLSMLMKKKGVKLCTASMPAASAQKRRLARFAGRSERM